MVKKLLKTKSAENRRQLLLTFFTEEEGYAELEVNGFWLIKHFNGDRKGWVVDIYPSSSYVNYKRASGELNYEDDQLKLL